MGSTLRRNDNMTEYKSFYKTVDGGEGDRCNYPTRLDMYGCGCQHDCNYCLYPDTMILMYDGTSKAIKDVEVGDTIYGFKKNGKFVKAEVLNKWDTVKDAYKVTLEDGTELICSGDHRWLSSNGWKYTTTGKIGEVQRPYLTISNTIKGVELPISTKKLKATTRAVISIEEYSKNENLIDITTSTENFIANGCISHNCYSKSLLEFRGLWNPQLPSMADRKKVARKLDKIESGTILRLGGMTDPFQPCESEYKHTTWLIEELNKRNIGYLIVTKSATVEDALSIMDKDLAHVQVSYTYTEGLAPEGYEKASEPRSRLKAAAKAQSMGIDTQIRLSPYIPRFVDLNKIIECPVEKVVVEFLRINPMILRTLPEGNWNDWREKSGGYKHLPLIVKCKMLEPLEGYKRITVCEDHPEHYKYFKEHYNPNPDDCCDLRK